MTDFFQKLLAGKEGPFPVSPFIHVNFVKAFFQSDEVDVVTRTPEVYRHFGFDLIHRNCTPAYNPVGESFAGWETKNEEVRDDKTALTTLFVKTPGGFLKQIHKQNRISVYDYEASPVEYPIKNRSDFELCRRYQPPPSPIDVTPVVRAKEAAGPAGVIAPWIQGAFNFAAFYFCKLDELLLYAMVDEPFYREMMEYFLERNIGYIDQILAAGPDLVSYAANIANAKLVSPKFFRKFVWEYEERLIRHIQGKGVGALFHNCGYAAGLLSLYAGLGMSGYESLTPPPYGDTVLEEALAVFPEEVVLSGNLDQIELLRKGTPGEVEAQTKNLIETVKKSGRKRFIVAATDYFSEDTPHENIFAFARAAKSMI
ncbi:MAG: uroporphyrinogen decarboxylase family protein [Candidatus Omnitrophota bacterium]|nr:hypothetical protein [Candidatus Omnitrophota bacterium]